MWVYLVGTRMVDVLSGYLSGFIHHGSSALFAHLDLGHSVSHCSLSARVARRTESGKEDGEEDLEG